MGYLQFVPLTYTPTISGATNDGNGTYTLQKGYYHRIGNLIFVIASITWTAHTGTGNMLITNLPFTIANLSGYDPEFIVRTDRIPWPSAAGSLYGEFQTNTKQGNIIEDRSNMPEDFVQMNNSGTVHYTGFYLTLE